MLRHIVVFKLYDNVSADQAIAILDSLRERAEHLEWSVKLSLDRRKGNIIVENSLFNSLDEFNSFKASVQHTEVADQMRSLADWWVGDYEE